MKIKTGLLPLIFAFFICLSAGCNTQPEITLEELSAPPVNQVEITAPTLEVKEIRNFQPAGVLVNPGDDASLFYYTPRGEFQAVISTPGISTGEPENVHGVNLSTSNGDSIEVMYYSWDPEQSIQFNSDGEIRILRRTATFLALAGVKGQSTLAFSEVKIEDNYVPHSCLYVGNPDNLSAAEPVYDLKDENMQMVLKPVAVEAEENTSLGIWYTQAAWGIGGVDLIYPITRGLYYFNLTTGENSQFLDSERNYQGISPDMQYAGSIDFEPDRERAMTVTNLNSGQSIPFPLKTDSERGAGYAVFSPASQYAAWLEASGHFASEPVSYQSVVRVGNLSTGNVEFEIEQSAIAQALTIEKTAFIKPVGWLNEQSLLIEARGEDWGQVYLVRLNLTDSSLSYFCDGSFAGFAYP